MEIKWKLLARGYGAIYWGSKGIILGIIGIMENKVEATILYGYISLDAEGIIGVI